MRPSILSSLLTCAALSCPSGARRCLAFTRPASTMTTSRGAPLSPLSPLARSAQFVTLSSTPSDDGDGSEESRGNSATATTVAAAEGGLDAAEVLQFALPEHKPLGCTAEESLAIEEDGAKHVFVSKVVEGGNADKAGIQTGDVIVGVSGSFNDVVNVAGLGIEKIRSLIAGRSPDELLSIKVARGTNVQARHESALVDLCTLPEMDTDLENCIASINHYDMDFDEDVPTVECGDEDTECMLDQMFEDWGSEMQSDVVAEKTEKEEEPKKEKPAPWSSRSSPSGTFVRDPQTGKMVNIDS